MDDTRRRELHDHFVAALMEQEFLDYEDAERVVGEFEKSRICPYCGSSVGQSATISNPLSGTIWAGNSR